MVQKVTIPEISKIAQDNLRIRIANNVVTDSKNLQDEEILIEEIIKEQLKNEIEIINEINEIANLTADDGDSDF